MAKKNRGRRKNSKHYSDSDDENETLSDYGKDKTEISDSKSSKNARNKSDLSFAERREVQRKAAAEKRRQKMKCYLCGKTGHVRRECPGIADDGRGESKYTKAHGDAGSVHLKQKSRKKNQNRHRSGSCASDSGLVLPPGFEKENESPSFLYYDAGFGDGHGVLEYLRFGRHGHGGKKSSQNHNNHNPNNHTQISRKDAISEHNVAMKGVCETTNFGGCIARSYMPLVANTDEPWNPRDSFPFSWCEERHDLLKFVIGYRCADEEDDDDNNEETIVESEEIINRMVETATTQKNDIVGFCADLDYTLLDHPLDTNTNKRESLRNFQLERLRNTLMAASKLDLPVQVRIEPGYKPCQQSPTPSSIAGEGDIPPIDGYSQAIRDLGQILLETSVHSWKVHLSSWNGKAEHLVALSGAFSSSDKTKELQHRLVFGFDGSLGFSKAIHLHESAFEVDPQNVVLETGGPGILPPVVAKHCGKNAFCHSGHIPFVAEELAKHFSKNPRNAIGLGENDEDSAHATGEINAETVARWAANTTKVVYGLS